MSLLSKVRLPSMPMNTIQSDQYLPEGYGRTSGSKISSPYSLVPCLAPPDTAFGYCLGLITSLLCDIILIKANLTVLVILNIICYQYNTTGVWCNHGSHNATVSDEKTFSRNPGDRDVDGQQSLPGYWLPAQLERQAGREGGWTRRRQAAA